MINFGMKKKNSFEAFTQTDSRYQEQNLDRPSFMKNNSHQEQVSNLDYFDRALPMSLSVTLEDRRLNDMIEEEKIRRSIHERVYLSSLSPYRQLQLLPPKEGLLA